MDVKKGIYLKIVYISFIFLIYSISAYIGEIEVDADPPVIQILTPANETLHGENVIIKTNITDNKGVKNCWIEYNNNTYYFDCKEALINLINETNYIYIVAEDIAGNVNKELLVLYKDTILPKIISYGYYPDNNTLINNPYFFWIETQDNYGIKYVIFEINENKILLEYNNAIYNVSVNITQENNYINWLVCDYSNLCTNLSFYFKVIIPQAPQITLQTNPKKLEPSETVEIIYSIKNFQEANLTIIDPKGKEYKYSLNESGVILFKNTNTIGIYNVTIIAKNYNYISEKKDYFEVIKLAFINVIGQKYASGELLVYKEEKIYSRSYFEYETKLKVEVGTYDLYIEAFNKTLKALFTDVEVKDKHDIVLDKEIKQKEITYFIKPTFWYKYVSLRLSYSELQNNFSTDISKIIYVYKCADYDYIKDRCNSVWIPLKFEIDPKNKEIIYNSSTLSAFKITLREDVCLFKLIYPKFLIVKKLPIEFNVTIINEYCKKPFNISLLNVEEYNLSKNNFYIDIGSNETVSIKISKIEDYKIELKIENYTFPIYIISAEGKVLEKENIIINPYYISIILRKNESTKKCFSIINIGPERTLQIESKYINESSIIRSGEKREYCIEVFGERIGIYQDSILLKIDHNLINIPVSIVVLPNKDSDIEIYIKDVVKKGEYQEGQIYIMTSKKTINIVICYSIINENNKKLTEKCKIIYPEMEIQGYKIVIYNIKEKMEQIGKYKLEVIAKVGTEYLYSYKIFEVVGEEKETKKSDIIAIIFIIVISVLLLMLIRRRILTASEL